MEESTERARANTKPPDLTGSIEILKHLLTVELVRLETAQRIEEKRDIVFPETSVIIHDIQKLQKEIERKQRHQDNEYE